MTEAEKNFQKKINEDKNVAGQRQKRGMRMRSNGRDTFKIGNRLKMREQRSTMN